VLRRPSCGQCSADDDSEVAHTSKCTSVISSETILLTCRRVTILKDSC
jgi:hypothetical protein